MERWCSAHHIRDLMDEFVVGFLRGEASSEPPKTRSIQVELHDAAIPAAAAGVPAVPQVYGELYQRTAGQAYVHHAGELLTGSSRQLTINALRTFLKSKLDSKAMWRCNHPYILVLVEGGEASHVRRASSTTSALLTPQQQLVEQSPSQTPVFKPAQWSQEAALSAIAAAVAQSVARGLGRRMYCANPARLFSPDGIPRQMHWPLEQRQQQELLQQLARALERNVDAPAWGTGPSAGCGGGESTADAALITPEMPSSSEVAPQLPIVLLAEWWPYTIADGLALEGLLGSPLGVFLVSMDERDHMGGRSAVNHSSGTSEPSHEASTEDSHCASRCKSSAHTALLEYYAAKKKLVRLAVPASLCSILAQEAAPVDVEQNPSAGPVVKSLVEKIMCNFH